MRGGEVNALQMAGAHVSLSHESPRPPHCCPCSALHEHHRSRRRHLVAFESRSEKVPVSSNSQLSYKYIMVQYNYITVSTTNTINLRSIRTPWRNRRWCVARRVRTTVPPESSDEIVAVTNHRVIGEQVSRQMHPSSHGSCACRFPCFQVTRATPASI